MCRGSVCEGLGAGHMGVIDVDAPLWAITAGDLERLFVRFICHLERERGEIEKMEDYTVNGSEN